MQRLLDLGWVDLWRHFHPNTQEYTWKSTAGNGFRLDHAFASPSAVPRVTNTYYSHAEREAKVSDHSMLIIDLEN